MTDYGRGWDGIYENLIPGESSRSARKCCTVPCPRPLMKCKWDSSCCPKTVSGPLLHLLLLARRRDGGERVKYSKQISPTRSYFLNGHFAPNLALIRASLLFRFRDLLLTNEACRPSRNQMAPIQVSCGLPNDPKILASRSPTPFPSLSFGAGQTTEANCEMKSLKLGRLSPPQTRNSRYVPFSKSRILKELEVALRRHPTNEEVIHAFTRVLALEHNILFCQGGDEKNSFLLGLWNCTKH